MCVGIIWAEILIFLPQVRASQSKDGLMAFSRIDRNALYLFAFVAASWAVIALFLGVSRVDIDFRSFLPVEMIPLALCAASLYFARLKEKRLVDICNTVAAGWFLLIPVLASTYLAMSLQMPLADDELIAMDEAVGFDWAFFIWWVDSQPVLSKVLGFTYSLFEYQLLLMPILLICFGFTSRAYAFIAGYGILCFISSIIAIWFPAIGTYGMYGVSQADMQNLNIRIAFGFLESFNAVRADEPFVLSLGVASGILTFPSVHAGMAALLIWASWPHLLLRSIFLPVNIAMAISAITHANHYFVDVVSGLVVAAVTALLVSSVFLRQKSKVAVPNPAQKESPLPESIILQRHPSQGQVNSPGSLQQG
jgi:membrane-associated phospholipid phosphatase